MTQHKICEELWVGDDQYNSDDYEFIIDLRGWDAEKTFRWETFDEIDRDVELVGSRVKLGKTLVHCHGGIDRSPFICAMHLHVNENMHPHEAYGLVKSCRPQTLIHYEWMYPYLEYLGFRMMAD